MQMKPLILCIDDDEHNRTILSILLYDVMNFTKVQFWADSNNFVERMLALPEKPALILMDIQVRPLNGYQMLELLRQQPDLQAIKVIALTASVMEDQVNKMKQAGFDGLIGKPIVRHLFPKIVQKLMAGESIWYIS